MLRLSTVHNKTGMGMALANKAGRRPLCTWAMLLLFMSLLLCGQTRRVLAAPLAVEAPPNYRTQWGSFGSNPGQFNRPFGVAVDSSGNVYVADVSNQRVQKFTSSGAFLSAISGQFSNPYGLAIDSSGNLYVTNLGSHQIQKYNSSGNFLFQIGSQGSGIGQLNTPYGVATDSSGNIYVADTFNHRIQKFNSSGNYLSQFGSLGSFNGQFNRPYGVAVDSSGNIYVVDGLNQRIQKFNSAGVYLTQWGGSGNGDGRFTNPSSVVLDSSGNVYVVDSGNHRIQKFTNNGVYLSQWGSNGSGNGQFASPVGVAISGSGAIYVTEFNNHRVQVFGYGPVAAEIELRGNGLLIANNSGPNSSNHTDFGGVPASGGTVVRTFTIANIGNSSLTVAQPTVIGGNATDFVISRAPAGVVDAGSVTTFDVTFDPAAVGFRYATITIANSDSDENPYTFGIMGYGSNYHRLVTATTGDGIGAIVLNPPGGLYAPGTVVTATVNLGSWSVLSSWAGNCSGTGPCVLTMDDAKQITATITYAEPPNAEAPPPYRTQFGVRGADAGQLNLPSGVAVDSSGNVYVADTNNNRIQKFSAGGALLSYSLPQSFGRPAWVTVDGNGNVYVVDGNNFRIQKFDSNGVYLTQVGYYGSANGQLLSPTGMALDSGGNIYVADSGNHRIQKFDSTGVYLTKWGTRGSGPGQFDSPRGVAVDSSGKVYVVDWQNHRIQKFDSNGVFLAQWGTRGKRAGQFDFPQSISIDSSGNLYVVDGAFNHRIQKFTGDGAFLTQWGAFGNGLGFFNLPTAVAVDGNGTVYVADAQNYRIQRFGTDTPIPEVELQGNGVTIANGDSTPSSPPGTDDYTDFGDVLTGNTAVRTYAIRNLGSADLTNVAVTISGNAAFSLSAPPSVTVSSGYTTTFGVTFAAGTVAPMTATVTITSNDSDESAYTFVVQATSIEAPPPYLATVGSFGGGDGQFYGLSDVAVDSSGNIYVSDNQTNRIQKFNSSGAFLTKWGTQGSGDGQFFGARAITVDTSGNLYVIDGNNRIQKFDSNGNFLTKWGSNGATSAFGLSVDGNGNIYVADTYNHRIQKFDSNGVYLTQWGTFGSGNGQFNQPYDVIVDGNGNLYVADSYNYRIQKFDSNGNFLTKWGGTQGRSRNGQFDRPMGVAVDGSGNVYVTDATYRIQKFDSSGNFLTKWLAQGSGNNPISTLAGLTLDGNGKVYLADRGYARIQIFSYPTPSPEIDVRGNGIAIASGDTTPAGADHTDFGAVSGSGSTVARTFAIHNIGTAALTGIAATLSGDAAFSLSTLPAATISATKSTTFTITFAPSVRSVVTAVVSLANSDSNENPYTFVIRGARVNDAPVAVNGALTTNEDTAQSVTLPASDGDSDALTYAIVNQPANGLVTLAGNTAIYTPTANFNGSDSFTFKANDGAVDSTIATVAVTVNSVNDAPQTRLLSKPLNPSTANVSFTFDGSDLDGTVAAFECKLDSGAFAPCSSPQAYSGLSVGSHTFLVRAVDNSGAVDPTPARYTWDVTAGGASITIELAMTPEITSNVRFTGTLGTFFLDDGAADDGDAYTNSQVFTVAAGSYTVNQRVSSGWLLTAIACTPAAGATPDLANNRLTLTVVDGDAVTCRFVTQQAVRINARAYQDVVRNGLNLGRKNTADPYLANIGMSLYLSPTNSLVGTATTLGVSAVITEARFSNLSPGAYVVCPTWAGGWTPTEPNPALPLPGYPGGACKSVTLQPGQAVNVLFGAYQPAVVSSTMTAEETDTYETDTLFDLPVAEWVDDVPLTEDDSLEEGDDTTETATLAQRSFLPLVLK